MAKKTKNKGEVSSLPEKEFKRYQSNLRVAKTNFDESQKKNIEIWRNYYRGFQWGGHVDANRNAPSSDETTDNIIFSNIKTILPSINFRNPKVFVKPIKKPFNIEIEGVAEGGLFDTISASTILEIVLNYYYKKLSLKREVDKALLDALIGPWGLVRLGYTIETEKIGDENEKSKKNKLLEVNELIKSEAPFAMRISPKDFLTDANGKDSHLTDAEWVAFKWVRRLEDVQDDPNFINTDKLKTNVTTQDNKDGVNKGVQTSENHTSSEDDFQRVEGWQIWDRKKDKVIDIVLEHNQPLRVRDRWPLFFDGGFPVETLYFNENPDELYPISDVGIILDSQDELNLIRENKLSHIRKISQRRYIVLKGTLDSDNLRKLENGGDGTIIEASDESRASAENAIVPIQDAPISFDLSLVERDLKNSIREESGIAQFEKGVAQKFETATEPALISQGVTLRRDERGAVVEEFIERILRKLAMILQQTMGKEESFPLNEEEFDRVELELPEKIEKIAGPDDSRVTLPWLNASKDDIQGEYEFQVEVGSTRPISEQQRRQDAVSIAQIVGSNPEFAQHINSREAIKRILTIFDVKEIDQLLIPEEQVGQAQEQAKQDAINAEEQREVPKRETQQRVAQTKGEAQLVGELIKAGSKQGGGS